MSTIFHRNKSFGISFSYPDRIIPVDTRQDRMNYVEKKHEVALTGCQAQFINLYLH